MARVYNFSAGPSTLPVSVLEKAGAEILDYQGSGQSVMEMSHRSKVFDDIIKSAEKLMRELYKVPDNYKVLFLQGGASAQFSAIPLNFMNGTGKADYIITGQWAKKAFQEAKKYGDVREAASSADKTFSYIPKTKPEDFREDADYVYICMNNTIYGTNEVQDVIGVTILGAMKNDPAMMEVADKYMTDYMSGPVHEINKITAKKNRFTKKLANPPAYKPKKKKTNMLQNALNQQQQQSK